MTPIPIRAAFVQKELRLYITLSGRSDRGAFIALWNRLDAFLRGSGLLHSLGLCSLVLYAVLRRIPALSRTDAGYNALLSRLRHSPCTCGSLPSGRRSR